MTFSGKKPGRGAGKRVRLQGHRRVFFAAALCVLVLFAVLFKMKDPEPEPLRGVISVNGAETGIMEGLFIREGKNTFLLRTDAVELLSLDVFDTAESFIVRDRSHQIELKKESGDYVKDSVLFSDDDSYRRPVKTEDALYVDGDFIFDFFGLTAEYYVSGDRSTVKLYLSKAEDADLYSDVSLKGKPKTKEDTAKAVTKEEEFVLSSSAGRMNPGELPTVPVPDELPGELESGEAIGAEPDPDSESVEQPDNHESGAGEDEASEVMREGPETEDVIKPTEPIASVDMGDGRVNRTPERPQRKTQEEFEKVWSDCKGSLINIFSGGTPSPGNIAWQQRTDNVIVFNPMRKGIYYDTVSVSYGLSDGTFVSAKFCSDWSDMAANTFDEGSAAYYRGIPGIYLNALCALLGESEGRSLFDYISSNADKAVTGGYEFSYDDNGNLQSAWSDAMVSGDGLRASVLDFSQWQDRETSYGLRYSVNSEGDGLRVRIFKD